MQCTRIFRILIKKIFLKIKQSKIVDQEHGTISLSISMLYRNTYICILLRSIGKNHSSNAEFSHYTVTFTNYIWS